MLCGKRKIETDSAQVRVDYALGGLLAGMIPAKELINISFPECSAQCAAVDYFGVCECESVCPQKIVMPFLIGGAMTEEERLEVEKAGLNCSASD